MIPTIYGHSPPHNRSCMILVNSPKQFLSSISILKREFFPLIFPQSEAKKIKFSHRISIKLKEKHFSELFEKLVIAGETRHGKKFLHILQFSLLLFEEKLFLPICWKNFISNFYGDRSVSVNGM